MAQRHESKDSLDGFPTPSWATRALLEHVIGGSKLSKLNCLKPACIKGYMSRVLEEYFSSVQSSDVWNYSYGKVLYASA
jgi:hypothetical protein